MEKKRTQEAARQCETLPQQAAERDLDPATAAPARNSARISLNEKGELTISAAGSRRIEKAFLGATASIKPSQETAHPWTMVALRNWRGRWRRLEANAEPLMR